MINRDRYRNFLLQNMYGATVGSGGDEVICKCKYCADNGDHYHMNISIPKTENELSFHNCWKCHSSGVVTYKKLLEWGVYNQDIATELTIHNQYASNNSITNNIELLGSDINNIRRLYVCNNPTQFNYNKLKYINDRLGLNLTFDDLNQNNIILNLGSFLNLNHITSYTRDFRVIESLSDYFVGFLSHDNCFVNLRRIVDEGMLHKSVDKKYINYNIYGKRDNTRKFIITPTNIDVSLPVNIHIGEGPFDVLSIKYNLRTDHTNSIFCAATGNEYLAILRYIICSIGIIQFNLHLYLDADDAGFFQLNIITEYLKGFPHIPVFIHTNTIGKDMGVPKNEIEESIQRLF